ncbi:hypothetical protein LSTR_LSTR009071, partial [Laodelphax striatellus]
IQPVSAANRTSVILASTTPRVALLKSHMHFWTAQSNEKANKKDFWPTKDPILRRFLYFQLRQNDSNDCNGTPFSHVYYTKYHHGKQEWKLGGEFST